MSLLCLPSREVMSMSELNTSAAIAPAAASPAVAATPVITSADEVNDLTLTRLAAVLGRGYVIEHVPAGGSLSLLNYLKIDPSEETVVIATNVASRAAGHEDLLGVRVDEIDTDMLALFAPHAIIARVEEGKPVRTVDPVLPARVVNTIRCVNPRCVTQTEPYLDQVFVLADKNLGEYRCEYCSAAAQF